MVKIEREPLIAGRHPTDNKNPIYFSEQQTMITVPQDDFFIIGPSDTRFAPAIAYPNRLKVRSRSTSPGLVRFTENPARNAKIPTRFNERVDQGRGTKTSNTNTSKSDQLPAPIRRAQTAHTRQNEAIQTDTPKRALEAEIQRIRSDLERRKRELRARATESSQQWTKSKHKHHKEPKGVQKRVEIAQPPPPPIVSTTQATPMAPRDTIHPAPRSKEPLKRQRSASPTGRPHRTEYQYAYRTPEIRPFTRTAQATEPARIARAQTESNIHARYESEYRREYKPFKYVPVEQLKSTGLQNQHGVNIVPIPRPRSAIIARPSSAQIMSENDARIKRPVRSLTPPAKMDGDGSRRPARRRYKTEYMAKYTNFSQPVSRTNSPKHQTSLLRNWHKEWDELRQQAENNRERDRRSHFTPNHLGQLDSVWVDCWDPPSSSSASNQRELYTQLNRPPAGKPSLIIGTAQTNPDNWVISKRREAMYDSHHVAEVLDPEDPWDDSSSQSNNKYHSIHTDCGTPKHKPSNQIYPTNPSRVQPKERLSSIFPQGQITRDFTSNSADKPAISSSSQPFEFPSSGSSLGGDISSGIGGDSSSIYAGHDHWARTQDLGTEDKARKSLISTTIDIDPTVTFSTPSPLSVRSMVSSASIASDTLQRAKRQRDRMLRDYETRHENTYSPNAYGSPIPRHGK
ncbi:unnamed protein product [Echinostoma caproni]|uniref:Nuclear protein MDM1 n=1 Tax=Echinostoma caproni TaxID=27848 RepID=A0A183AN98_9TREM|nr:unnamed protein product [Echinostoma caproni]